MKTAFNFSYTCKPLWEADVTCRFTNERVLKKFDQFLWQGWYMWASHTTRSHIKQFTTSCDLDRSQKTYTSTQIVWVIVVLRQKRQIISCIMPKTSCIWRGDNGVRFVLDQLVFIVLAHWNNSTRVNKSLHLGQIILIQSQSVFPLFPICYMLSS